MSLVLTVAVVLIAAPAAASTTTPPRVSPPLDATSCVAGGGAVRVDPRARGSLTLDARGLRAHEPVDVLLNTEAGATLLARRTTSAKGALCRADIPIPPRFVIPNSRVPGGSVTVPLHDPLEEYQLSIIGETYGDGFSLALPIGL